MKILVVDDHAVVRAGIRQILSNAADIEIVAEAETGQSAIDMIEQINVDVVLLDLSLPGKDGFDVLREIKNHKHTARVLVLTIYPEQQYAVRAIKAGASGYLTKDSLPEELINALRIVASGQKYISSVLAQKLAEHLIFNREKTYEKISHREFQVMQFLAKGLSMTEIAETLHLSIKTVSTYKRRLLEKLGLRTTAEIIIYAIKNDLA